MKKGQKVKMAKASLNVRDQFPKRERCGRNEEERAGERKGNALELMKRKQRKKGLQTFRKLRGAIH